MVDVPPLDSTNHPTGLLDTAGAAAQLNLGRRTLERLRVTGGGPRYLKLGRQVRYRAEWLDEWANSRAFESTIEAKRAGIV